MKRVYGFTLVEVMVAMLVLATGLLGLAGLNAISLRKNHTAYLRTQAIVLAQDMADRMRAAAATPMPESALAFYLAGATGDDCAANPCTVSQMAGYEVARWNQSLARQLAGGEGKIMAEPGGIYNISISWLEHGDNPQSMEKASRRSVDMSFQP
jgi:type IV pilus assembly protein PilV